jgi:Arc/MetJ family transcription regulator
MARLSITVDPQLLAKAQRLAKARTKREAIEQALREFIRHCRRRELHGLAGAGWVDMELAELRQWRPAGLEEP